MHGSTSAAASVRPRRAGSAATAQSLQSRGSQTECCRPRRVSSRWLHPQQHAAWVARCRPASDAVLRAPHCYSRLVRFSWLRASALLPVHDSCLFVFSPSVFLLDVVAPSLLHVTVTTPSSVRVERDSDSRFDKSRFGRLLFSSGHHHVKEQPVPTPATDPVGLTFMSNTIPLSQGPGGLSCPSIVTHPD